MPDRAETWSIHRLVVLLFLLSTVVSPALAESDEDEHAAVVVRMPDGAIQNSCVALTESSITGEELLARTPFRTVKAQGQVGTAVCSIDGQGCSSGDCFCEFPRFWGYWTRESDDDEWTFSELGAAQRRVRAGSMDAWVWGKDGKPPPPDVALDDVCTKSAAQTQRPSPEPPAPSGSGIGSAAIGIAVIAAALIAVVFVRRRFA